MKFTQRQILIVGGVIVVIVGIFYLLSVSGTKKPTGPVETLTVWGTESAATMGDLIADYEAARPNVTVTYKQIDQTDYQSQVLLALSAGDGPDIFEISNRELPVWQSTLAPMPTSTFGTEFSIAQMQSYFPPVVANDFVSNGNIYALPFSIDTLAMYYNENLLNSAGIALPPTTWDEFDADIPKLRTLNSAGQITQAAAAIGGTKASIPNAEDILYLLMLQNDTTMISADDSYPTFASQQGETAMNFYLQFSNAASPYYTWNDGMGNALQSFVQGKTAIMFDYYSALAQIKQQAPFLNVEVAPIPQPTGATIAVNYPKYSGFAVAKKGNVTYGWDFILYLAAQTGGESAYVKDTGAPAAQRVALATQVADASNPTLAIFADQALSAQSWYEANDTQIDSIFDTALQNVLNGSMNVNQALESAQQSVTGVMSQ